MATLAGLRAKQSKPVLDEIAASNPRDYLREATRRDTLFGGPTARAGGGGHVIEKTGRSEAHYSFGDRGPAAERLRRLAELHRPLSAEALEQAKRVCGEPVGVAIDLGAGPGYTTELVAAVSGARRVIGYERSRVFCAQARERLPDRIAFVDWDVAAEDLPVEHVDLAFCRFLLTHLPDPVATLRRWHRALRSGGVLVLIELERLSSSDPILTRYYALIDGVQTRHGQQMFIGGALEGLVRDAGYAIVSSSGVEPGFPAAAMACLHRPNLDNVRRDPWVQEHFIDAEIDEIAAGLERIAAEEDARTPIDHVLRVVVARRSK
jgi:trans-aconitate 2-methyltransferase